MAIPNPNPNIADYQKCDNKTYSSNKIESLITMATELPIPAEGDAGKVLTVNAGATGYELDTPVAIDDSATSASTTYSSSKIESEIPTTSDIETIADTEIEDYLSLSTTEKKIGKYGNDDLYEKVVTLGALPSVTGIGIEYSLGITGVDKIIDYSLVVSDGSNYINLPFYSSTIEYVITGYLEKKSDNSIVAVIAVGMDRSSYTDNKVIVRYTKTSI